jgi:anaerobic selenocysteine-containing dehydrogenase
MVKNGVVRSTCTICFSGCGILVHLRDGEITKIEGDPDAPLNKGALCAKGLASLEYLHHPDRLKHPLRRIGERGEGKWQRISWDEALSTIASEMNQAKDKYGVESVIFFRGAAKGLQDNVFTRLANAFGSPNITSMAHVCFHARRSAFNITFGSFLLRDYDYPPACIVLWGSNPEATCIPTYEGIVGAMGKGAKLVVIDPRESGLARKAALWIHPRPGSDLALALGMINVVINEGLFDKDFVANWTAGFDELRAHIQGYSPERVEEITWVPAEVIRQATRFYAANSPAGIESGNALEHTVNSFQTQRAIFILEAISGNIGVPGGTIQWASPPILGRGSPAFTLQDNIPTERRDKRFGAEYMAPFVKYALPQIIAKGLLERAPSRGHVAYVQGGNSLVLWSNAKETFDALNKFDFIAVADIFMTPTAELADIVLPVATHLEFDSISHSAELPCVAQVQQKVTEVGECWSDSRILIELGKKLGLGQYFWNDEHEFLDELLKPAGLTFEEFRQVGAITGVKQYRHYQANGFNTPSGKVELYSSNLKQWGFDPLPTYHELPETPYSDPELAKEYPLIFTNWKPGVFRHSMLRQVSSLRSAHPEPIVNINPQTAKKLRIKDGDWVYIETKRGRIKHKAGLTDSLDPRVVVIEHGWWYPEQGITDLHGWTESNANILTNNKPPYSREMGTPTLRGILCKVYKA